MREGVAGGNPVIPLVGMLKAQVPEEHRAWIHRGATSQDILDTPSWSSRAGPSSRRSLDRERRRLGAPARHPHADDVAAARTLTQHAVPTTIGARARPGRVGWSAPRSAWGS